MRIRITQRLSGSIDGIQLGRFIPGLTYNVGTTVANYLLAERLAVPLEPTIPALTLPIQGDSEVTELPAKWQDALTKSDGAPRPKPTPRRGR